MLNLRDLRTDPTSLGRKMLLVDVMPAYEYKTGERTETVTTKPQEKTCHSISSPVMRLRRCWIKPV